MRTWLRGCGKLARLHCPTIENANLLAPSNNVLALTRNRRLILETDADLRQHTTIAAARDLEAVRKAIGARQIDPSALVQFYARRSAATLDTTCIARMRPMPFRLSER